MPSKSLGTRLQTLKTISVNRISSLRPANVDSFNKHFQIDKKARFATRGFQIFVAFMSWFFIGRLDDGFISLHGLYGPVRYMWFCAVCSPVVAGVLVAQYFVNCVAKSWSSLKVLVLELICDLLVMLFWLACLISLAAPVGKSCPPGTSSECTNFNWVLAWGALSFVFWFVGVVWDVQGFLKGVWGWGGEELNEVEMDGEIRRLNRQAGSGRRWR
ncbi:hypothetical protein DFS34DRAFT_627065 [Phlyctochytrium arcticum]|nr:hypothetical protein DFS34DRAFT_627065 [Phlyctochytrium arcticum]